MTGIIILISILTIYPLWLFIKLSRYGQNILRPNFERMKRIVDEWTGFTYDGYFAYNRPGGKLIYYSLLFYLTGLILFITVCSLVR